MASAASRVLPLLLAVAWPARVASEGLGEALGTNSSDAGGGQGKQAAPPSAHKMVTGASVSAMMLGSVVFIMSLTYLVHWPVREIRVITWKLTSSITSIFIAVMIHAVFVAFARAKICPYAPHWLVWFTWLSIFWLVVQAVIFLNRRSKLGVTARATIGGHLLGFSAIHVFGTLQEHPLLRGQWRPLVVLPLFFSIWACLSWVSQRLRLRVEDRMLHMHPDAQEERAEVQFEVQCQDAENDTACITLGFLLTQVVGSAIIGELPPLEGEPPEPNSEQNAVLFCAALAFMVTVFAFEVMENKEHSPNTKRMFNLVRGVLAMSMSWCWLFWGRWHLWRTVRFEELFAKVALACSTSAFVMIWIFILNALAERGVLNRRALRAVIQAFGLLVGFAWESSFEAVMEDLQPAQKKNWAGILLAMFVLPGWRLYILPKAMEMWRPEHDMSPPSAASLCLEEDAFTMEEDFSEMEDEKSSSMGDSESCG